jgi:hypothetical protein
MTHNPNNMAKRRRGAEVEEKPAKKKKKEEEVLDDESDIEEVEMEEAAPQPTKPGWDTFKYTTLNYPASDRAQFNGWKDSDYKSWQKKAWKYHSSKKTAFPSGVTSRVSGTALLVPPFDREWPALKFTKNMPFADFVHAIASSQNALDIMRLETNVESSANTTKRDVKSPNFHQSRMQWTSWSAMLAIELVYPGVMEGCQGFGQCLEVLWKKELNSSKILKMKREKFDEWLEKVLKDLNIIVHQQWRDVGNAHPKTVRTFVSVRIIESLRRSAAWAGTPKEQDERMVELHKKRWFFVPEKVVGSEFSTAKKRLTKFLTKPQQIHERDIIEGVRTLFTQVWPDKGLGKDMLNPISFGSPSSSKLPDRVRAAVCLLELMCGSRLIGVMFVNFFERLTTGTVAEWKVREPETMAAYGSVDTSVVVTRLSKEGTKASRARKTETEESEVYDRAIVKPLVEAFVDPVLLFGNPKAIRTSAVEMFMRLVVAVREYIYWIPPLWRSGAEWEKRGGMYGLTDQVAEQIPTGLRKDMNNMNTLIVNYARRTFPFFKANQGTHLFRKIYMNWAYNSYASDTMKETGFAAAVLGHRGYQVSLNYTSLIIVPSIPSKELSNAVKMQARMAALETRLLALEKRNPGVLPDKQPFINSKGKLVDVEYLPRAQHRSTFEVHLERAREIIKRLKANDVPVTWVNIKKMKVNTREDVGIALFEEEPTLKMRRHIVPDPVV